MSRFDDQDLRILGAVQFEANLSVPEIAKRARVRVHQVHYLLQKANQAGVTRPGAIIDTSALGLEQFEVLFSLAAPGSAKRGQAEREKLVTALKKHPAIAWFAELGAQYQYGVSICAKSAFEAAKIFLDIERRQEIQVVKRGVVAVLQFTTFRKRYLWGGDKVPAPLTVTIGGSPKASALDDLDARILSALFKPHAQSHRAMAQHLAIPRSTIDYRLRKLEQAQVLKSYVTFINARKLGYTGYKILLVARGSAAALEQTLSSFSLACRDVVYLARCFGAWDFELGVEVKENQSILPVLDSLHDVAGKNLQDVSPMLILSQSNSTEFLGHIAV